MNSGAYAFFLAQILWSLCFDLCIPGLIFVGRFKRTIVKQKVRLSGQLRVRKSAPDHVQRFQVFHIHFLSPFAFGHTSRTKDHRGATVPDVPRGSRAMYGHVCRFRFESC